MNTYLVTLSLGPVQSLIEAARRTRDLWCGSWLLAEASKAAARSLHKGKAKLIFPCPDMPDEELAPSDKPKDDDANIANILRAEVDAENGAAVRSLLDGAKQAAADRLAVLCNQAKNKLGSLPFHENIWQAQMNDILESFAAWEEIDEGGYAVAANRLGGMLAARKATRNFVPAAIEPNGLGFGIPKSSLDGARESVIHLSRKDREQGQHKSALRKLGMNGGEELDALGIAKRMAGNIDQFTAYSRIAADPWIETLEPEQRDRIKVAYAPLVESGLATGAKGNAGIYANLPYDAQLVFGFRLDNALAAKDIDATDREKLKGLRTALTGLDEPVPYAVILKADGDRMGELLDKATNANQSRAISKALHGFAKSVRGIVRVYRGHAIYAGGDDVLALLPLENAVACAQKLAETFKAALNEVAAELGVPETNRPTFSVGLGIGHVVEPLGKLRARADAAEKLAKGDGAVRPRNALAIQLGVRSGAEMPWRCRWDDPVGIQTLQDFVSAYRTNMCPSRLGYDLRAIALRLDWAKEGGTKPPSIHAAELARTLDRARQRGGEGELRKEMKALVTQRAEQVGLSQLADELIIARWLSARTQSDIGSLE